MGGNPLAPVQYAPHDCEKARASNCKRAGTQMDEPESCQNSPHATQRHNVHRRSTFETHGWITAIRDGPVRGASGSTRERERMQNASPWRSVGSRGPEDSGEKKNPAMPGSPVEVKVHSRSIPSAMPPLPPINPSGPRPASFSSTALTNGINHSPPTLNGVPSPPQRFSNGPSSSSSSSLANQQLPATCGARQLSKLKRFLTTLQQFGNDISPEIGESVRNLVLALVSVVFENGHGRLCSTAYLKCKAGGKMGGNPLAPVQYAPHDCEKARASNCKRAGTQMDEPESCQNSPHATQRHNVHRRSTFETHGWITAIRDGPVRGASGSTRERERMQNASPWRSVGSRGPEGRVQCLSNCLVN
ncbi:Protein CBFA2T2 [Acipenser ruthenus]|uniref:Protein CBFA2T2 n=1 Tax=Acipenser ruthenus TaxID=7906 RepID=A0A444V071_ACIRT|nr:Protein CBFA2T2 [Acipenser ruthenus]